MNTKRENERERLTGCVCCYVFRRVCMQNGDAAGVAGIVDTLNSVTWDTSAVGTC